MEFKELTQEPFFTVEAEADIVNGYIDPASMLKNKKDINEVRAAIRTLQQFQSEAIENGHIVVLAGNA